MHTQDPGARVQNPAGPRGAAPGVPNPAGRTRPGAAVAATPVVQNPVGPAQQGAAVAATPSVPNPAGPAERVGVVPAASAVQNPLGSVETRPEPVQNPAGARERKDRLERASDGRAVRPWEVTTAAILGAISPIFVAIAIVWSVLMGGRAMRWLGWSLEQVGDGSGWQGVSDAGEVVSTLARILLVIGVVAGVLVIVAFLVYAWRLLSGRGHARWIALGVLVLALLVVLPMSPALVTCFLIVGTASVVFAFLPRSSAWFAERRARARARGDAR